MFCGLGAEGELVDGVGRATVCLVVERKAQMAVEPLTTPCPPPLPAAAMGGLGCCVGRERRGNSLTAWVTTKFVYLRTQSKNRRPSPSSPPD